MADIFGPAYKSFRVHRLSSLGDLSGIDRYEFAERFRSTRPSILLCPLKRLPFTCLIVTAPIDHALCAYRGATCKIFRSAGEWGKRQRRKPEVSQPFLQEIEESGFKLNGVPSGLVGNFNGIPLGDAKNRTIFLEEWGGDFGASRNRGEVYPNEVIESVVQHLDRTLACFGRVAFAVAAENTEATERALTPIRPWFPIQDLDLLERLPLVGYSPQLQPTNESEAKLWLQTAIKRVEHLLMRLGTGLNWNPTCDFRDFIQVSVLINLGRRTLTGEHVSLHLKLFKLRSALIRKLCWPHLAAPPLPDSEEIELIHGNLLAHALDRELCLEIISDLQRYQTEISVKYPPLISGPAFDEFDRSVD